MSDEQTATVEGSATESAVDAAESIPDFPLQTPNRANNQPTKPLGQFENVQVAVTGQLGIANVTIQEMLNLSVGAIVELDRKISEPVELVAQGLSLGNGDIVVLDDRVAIRIKEIYQG